MSRQQDLIADLRQQVVELKRRIEQRPLLVDPAAKYDYYTVEIDQGNYLETGQDGILYEATVENLTSAFDPNVDTTFDDGLGRGTLYKNGLAQPGYVLVVNDDRGTFRNALIQSDVIYAGGPVRVTVAAGGSVRAWTAG